MWTATSTVMIFTTISTADGIDPARAVGSMDVGSGTYTEQKPTTIRNYEYKTVHYCTIMYVSKVHVVQIIKRLL